MKKGIVALVSGLIAALAAIGVAVTRSADDAGRALRGGADNVGQLVRGADDVGLPPAGALDDILGQVDNASPLRAVADDYVVTQEFQDTLTGVLASATCEYVTGNLDNAEELEAWLLEEAADSGLAFVVGADEAALMAQQIREEVANGLDAGSVCELIP